MKRNTVARLLAFTIAYSVITAGCGSNTAADTASATSVNREVTDAQTEDAENTDTSADQAASDAQTEAVENADITADQAASASQADAATGSDLFTDRDLAQEADLAEAETITVADGQDVSITEAGVYILTGTASECTVRVEADKEDKVQLVLDGVSITNTDSPAIYVVSADKVFITTTDSENSLSVTGTFTADGETNTDAVIFSKDDLVLNGLGTLTVSSTDNGITCKDDLKVTGGTYSITSVSDAVEANDSISIADGSFTIVSSKDGFHSENDEDDSLGSIYISGGSFDIKASDDGIQATSTLTIDGGTYAITAEEGLEGTYLTINDGTININASDDGINASDKSGAFDVVIEINGGDITVVMGAGDTDALDANGDLIINGGSLNITANSPFDYDRRGVLNGGTVIVNGQQVTQLTNSMMGMGGMGGPRGDQSGSFEGGMGGPQGDQSGSFEGGMGGPGGHQGGFGRGGSAV